MTRCHSCLTDTAETPLCSSCRRELFGGSKVAPHLHLLRSDLIKEASQKALRMSLGGAQPKATLDIKSAELQLVTGGGRYLIKPSTEHHPYISENEHFCMRVVREFKLPTAPCCLITLKDGEFAFLTKRFDRERKRKRHVEDFASVLNYPVESKYKASYAEVLEASDNHCRDKGLERLRLFKLILLSYLIGNSDLHLKNFSLIDRDTHYELAPIYDVVCAKLYYPDDQDLALEMAPDYLGSLREEGHYTHRDFLHLATHAGILEHQARRILQEIKEGREVISSILKRSFLPDHAKAVVQKVIDDHYGKLAL